VTPDFVATDHRPLGWGALTGPEFMEFFLNTFELVPEARWRLSSVDLVSPTVAVYQLELGGPGGESGPFGIPSIIAVSSRDGLMASLDNYGREQAAMAFERGRELAALPGGP